ncbi:hypothetical protein [Sphingomonas xinjiangensis]|uniref:Uncharacterized protein n=1 Tax=Sphingomonas xinjiangensis TaxID=643568 RepID=A0A840YSY5_9SPHN|nr:hypothetical protein [Sphingomonas xinjiangensis]MBB5712785.1 hypothetical protein [Sphingomonas xinjiangensis]
MLKPIYFGGVVSPCEAQFGIHLDDAEGVLHIIVIQSKFGTSLWNDELGRNDVLNTVLSQHVSGVRIEDTRYHIILEVENGFRGIEIPIQVDNADFRKRGNRVHVRGWLRKTYSIWSHNIVAGSARCYGNFAERRHLTEEDIKRFCAVLGYYSPNRLTSVVAHA